MLFVLLKTDITPANRLHSFTLYHKSLVQSGTLGLGKVLLRIHLPGIRSLCSSAQQADQCQICKADKKDADKGKEMVVKILLLASS